MARSNMSEEATLHHNPVTYLAAMFREVPAPGVHSCPDLKNLNLN